MATNASTNSLSAKRLPRLDERRCSVIGACITACPEGVIEIRGFRLWVLRHEHAVLAHPDRCTACEACVDACPVGAWRL